MIITTLDCLPCFMNQALKTARLAAPGDRKKQEAVVRAWAGELARADLDVPPPELAGVLYGLTKEMTGCVDPFYQEKKEANARVMRLLPELEARAARDDDPLEAALGLSIIGNYIDSGVPEAFDWEAALAKEESSLHPEAYQAFQDAARPGAKVVILGDNAGEIALDALLVRCLLDRGCEVAYAVRSTPVLNDATMEDAEEVGLTGLCRVVPSGVDTPGTVLSRCAPEFLKRLGAADLILSKGQGNFESLWGRMDRIFFAFKAKCRVVADLLGVEPGTSIFVQGGVPAGTPAGPRADKN